MSVHKSVINTLNAKWYVLLLARLLGKRSVEMDSFGQKVIIKTFRGKKYFMEQVL